jgi:hypothetical protein
LSEPKHEDHLIKNTQNKPNSNKELTTKLTEKEKTQKQEKNNKLNN